MQSRPPGGPRLLVVEDEPHLLKVYERRLGAHFDVMTSRSLEETRRILDDPGQQFDAAIIDYGLPDGTGAELVQPLLERQPLCKSLIVTGASREESATESARVGAHGYFRKPGKMPNLINAISRTVEATHEWRHALGQQPGQRVASVEPSPVDFDLRNAVARLRHIASLNPIETITAWRILWGDTNAEIAERLGTSPRNAKYHVSTVLARTGARSRSGLLRVILEDAGDRDPWE